MALDGSYDGLKASIADFLNRTDLAAAVPDFIRLAEAQMTRRFAGRVRQGQPVPRRLIQRADAEIDSGTEYLAVPSDFHGPIDFILQASPEIVLDYLGSTNLHGIESGCAAMMVCYSLMATQIRTRLRSR